MSVQDQIAAAARRYGVPVEIALAVAEQESRFNQSARGTSGEIGMFQLMPGTASDLGVNPYTLEQNIEGGVRYLRQQYERFGDWNTAVRAYNAGPGGVQRSANAGLQYVAEVFGRVPGWLGFGGPEAAAPGGPMVIASDPLELRAPLGVDGNAWFLGGLVVAAALAIAAAR